MPSPDERLLEFARRSLGELGEIQFRGWDHAQSQVWRLISRRGSKCYLKAFLQRKKFRQEAHFYQHWAESLSPSVPTSLDHDSDLMALLLSEMPGEPLSLGQHKPEQERQAHREAGRLLRKLHSHPYEDHDIPLGDALAARCRSWADRARNQVDSRFLSRLEERVAELHSELNRLRRVPCHRDYTPRNWLLSGSQLTVIDFEHSQADLHCLDFEKLKGQYWHGRPELELAFWEGYGRTLNPAEEAILQTCVALGAVGTVAWACRQGDSKFEELGRELLSRSLPGQL